MTSSRLRTAPMSANGCHSRVSCDSLMRASMARRLSRRPSFELQMTPRPFSDRTMPALAAVLVLALALLVAACGSNDEAKHPAGPKVEAPPGEHPLASLGSGEGRLDLVAPAGYADDAWVSDFETRTGCQVRVRAAPDPEEVVRLLAGGRYDGAAAPSDVMPQLIAE